LLRLELLEEQLDCTSTKIRQLLKNCKLKNQLKFSNVVLNKFLIPKKLTRVVKMPTLCVIHLSLWQMELVGGTTMESILVFFQENYVLMYGKSTSIRKALI
jgi:hypothetical protein